MQSVFFSNTYIHSSATLLGAPVQLANIESATLIATTQCRHGQDYN